MNYIDTFPDLRHIVDSWEIIRNEYDRAKHYLQIWQQRYLHNDSWFVFVFVYKGKPYLRNQLLCPETTELIYSIPRLSTAGYSIMKPGCVILPHSGGIDVKRHHLGLICHEGAYMEVNGERRGWKNGELFAFNDLDVHSAKNLSKKDRVILLFDRS